MWIIVASAIFAGVRPIIMDQLLGAILPNFLAGENLCMWDLGIFTSALVIGEVLFIRGTYNLNVSKMGTRNAPRRADGARERSRRTHGRARTHAPAHKRTRTHADARACGMHMRYARRRGV
jgi:hypothetical protein